MPTIKHTEPKSRKQYCGEAGAHTRKKGKGRPKLVHCTGRSKSRFAKTKS